MRICIACLLWLLTTGIARAADKLTVLLDWFVNPNHATLIVAQQIGAFRRAGLDVDLVQPADPAMPPRLVAAGHGDIAVNYQPMLYQQVAHGLPLLRIGALIDKSLETLETLQGYGITKIADLKGKRIGYNEVTGVVSVPEIATMLATAHLTLADITLVNVGTALTTSLLTHQVDAVGVDRNFEHFELIEKGAVPIGFDYQDYGVPEFDDLILEVNRASIGDTRLPRFLAALKEGAAYLKAHPEKSWQLFIQAYPDLDNELNRAAWNFSIPYFAADPAALDQAKYERFQSYLIETGVLKSALPISSYAVRLHP
jgi:putative hydroxymethylpyrimidine transport system substrate-binding protein